MSQRKRKNETLIPFQIIHYRVPRRFMLACHKAEELSIVDRSKLLKIKHDAERIINEANHILSVIDSTTRRACQQEIYY